MKRHLSNPVLRLTALLLTAAGIFSVATAVRHGPGVFGPGARRPVYPLSVVAGGIYNRTEAARARAADPVVAAHYADVNVSKLERVALERSRIGFVSYRKGNRIYWTRKPIPLQKGEAVLIAGKEMIRARCGNRISDTPRLPVVPDAEEEPEPAAFDRPEGGTSGSTSQAQPGGARSRRQELQTGPKIPESFHAGEPVFDWPSPPGFLPSAGSGLPPAGSSSPAALQSSPPTGLSSAQTPLTLILPPVPEFSPPPTAPELSWFWLMPITPEEPVVITAMGHTPPGYIWPVVFPQTNAVPPTRTTVLITIAPVDIFPEEQGPPGSLPPPELPPEVAPFFPKRSAPPIPEVPEPGTLVLTGIGFVWLAHWVRSAARRDR